MYSSISTYAPAPQGSWAPILRADVCWFKDAAGSRKPVGFMQCLTNEREREEERETASQSQSQNQSQSQKHQCLETFSWDRILQKLDLEMRGGEMLQISSFHYCLDEGKYSLAFNRFLLLNDCNWFSSSRYECTKGSEKTVYVRVCR